MALLSTGRRTDKSPATPTSINSRLLPGMLDPEKLETLGTLAILDFGRANSASLEFFNQYPCRLCVLDAADTLLDWSTSVAERAAGENPPSRQQLQHELTGLLDIGDHRYDLVFLWDCLNHLHELALPAFSALLRRHLTAKARGHGFIMHKREGEQLMRRMSLDGRERVTVHEAAPAGLHFHTRKAVNETLAPDLQMQHAVLHGDGRLEYLLSVATGR